MAFGEDQQARWVLVSKWEKVTPSRENNVIRTKLNSSIHCPWLGGASCSAHVKVEIIIEPSDAQDDWKLFHIPKSLSLSLCAFLYHCL